MLGLVLVEGITGFPSMVTLTTTAAEFAEVGILDVTVVLLNSPVTMEGVISNVVNLEAGVWMVVSTRVPPPLKLPDVGVPPTRLLMTHCEVWMLAVKLPLLC